MLSSIVFLSIPLFKCSSMGPSVTVPLENILLPPGCTNVNKCEVLRELTTPKAVDCRDRCGKDSEYIPQELKCLLQEYLKNSFLVQNGGRGGPGGILANQCSSSMLPNNNIQPTFRQNYQSFSGGMRQPDFQQPQYSQMSSPVIQNPIPPKMNIPPTTGLNFDGSSECFPPRTNALQRPDTFVNSFIQPPNCPMPPAISPPVISTPIKVQPALNLSTVSTQPTTYQLPSTPSNIQIPASPQPSIQQNTTPSSFITDQCQQFLKPASGYINPASNFQKNMNPSCQNLQTQNFYQSNAPVLNNSMMPQAQCYNPMMSNFNPTFNANQAQCFMPGKPKHRRKKRNHRVQGFQ